MKKHVFPEPTVGLFIFNPKGEVLLIKTHKWRGKYAVPGGHIELGETIEQAAKREAFEEIGLHIYNLRFIRVDEMVYDKIFFKKKHYVFIDYICQTKSTKVKLNDEAQEYLWIDPKKAVKMKTLEPYAQKTIEIYLQILKGKYFRFPAEVNFFLLRRLPKIESNLVFGP